jgi:hypothetical protein
MPKRLPRRVCSIPLLADRFVRQTDNDHLGRAERAVKIADYAYLIHEGRVMAEENPSEIEASEVRAV